MSGKQQRTDKPSGRTIKRLSNGVHAVGEPKAKLSQAALCYARSDDDIKTLLLKQGSPPLELRARVVHGREG
eukprot:scaffold13173_cov35-Tisochrysis_lutea.AAC.2